MKPTKEQIKWFWEQCGFIRQEITPAMSQGKDTFTRWLCPNGKSVFDFFDYMPPIDLNNLFKYAVPKLGELNLRLELALTAYSDANDYKIGRGFGTKLVYACSIYSADYKKMISQEVDDKDPALALFWAIYKAFESR